METQAPEEGSSEGVVSKSAWSGMSQKTRIKWVVLVVVVLLVGASLYYYRSFFVAATVNGSPISNLFVVQSKFGKQALDAAITQKLIDAELKKRGITVSADELAAEVKEIEASVQAQGGTLDQALQAQGMTRADLEKQLTSQLKVQKVLADKLVVSDAEADAYMTTNKITPPKGEEASMRIQVKAQLQSQKFNQVAGEWVSSLKASAIINYYVQY